MKERPIIFSSPMVKAILEGRKTQTRRVVRDQPEGMDPCYGKAFRKDFGGRRCPYGAPGDFLWVKETFAKPPHEDRIIYRATAASYEDATEYKWRPSIFMPRTASRIDLEIVNVLVERLQEISEEDAIKEGCPEQDWYRVPGGPGKWFSSTWDKINGEKCPWISNPWVWCIEFKRVTP